ncbi:hypothetical protein [Thermoactinomyces mirandus]|uniref:Uncharacterized protein n=1 Tax=Thermoactinomyces mirandus TaxID=2756294 RepID=A0A7W1XUI8_9BACL|nr:hypothetical protein [Thermoactinomyces mirandus]MBA4603495.1 hypothetical protein [Thermoactinomyces mirandus]
MDFIKENPILWGIVFVVLLIAIIAVISIIVSKNRRKEVEEIEKMFPSGNMTSEDIKISVERVRRATKEREKRKHKKPQIHRERPREAHPDEDKEIVRRTTDEAVKQDRDSSRSGESGSKEESVSEKKHGRSATFQTTGETAQKGETEPSSKAQEFFHKPGKMLKSDLLSSTINRRKIEKGDYRHSRGHSLLQETITNDKKKDLSVQQKTHKVSAKQHPEQTDKEMQPKGEQGFMDKAKSRRMFKRSLLKPDKTAKPDSGKLPKSSLIDTHVFSGKEENKQDETEASTLSRQKRVNNKSFFSKRK